MLSPSICKCVLASCLQRLQPSVSYNDSLWISHVAYSDDVLLLSRTKQSLNTNFGLLSAALSAMCFSVIAAKCEFLCFGSPPPVSSFCLSFSIIPSSASIKWLGIFFYHVTFVYLLCCYVRRAEKYAGCLRKNFTQSGSV